MAELDLNDIKRVDSFQSSDWTDYIGSMTHSQAGDFLASGRHKPCVHRIRRLKQWLQSAFVGKDELIELMLIATAAQLPMLLLGTWGTGKSMLVRKLAEGLGIQSPVTPIAQEPGMLLEMLETEGARSGAITDGPLRRHFEYLVTRFTTPEEILGTANIELMLKKAVYMRQTWGLLPHAEIVFLDEVFKANSSILNALLAIINERVFHNAGKTWRVNMVMLFGASNETPEEEDLGAFYDRFPVRILCEPVPTELLPKLLDVAHANAFSGVFRDETVAGRPRSDAGGRRDGTETRLACVNDFRLLHKMSLLMFGGERPSDGSDSGEQFLKRFTQLFAHLRTRYDLSDRSFGQYYRLARARALLDDRNRLVLADGRVLLYCGKDPASASELRSIVDQFLSE